MEALQAKNRTVADEMIVSGSFESDGKVFEKLPVIRRIALESSFGEGSFIRYEFWLPENWNGVFAVHGDGERKGHLISFVKDGNIRTLMMNNVMTAGFASLVSEPQRVGRVISDGVRTE
ncbi:MAG: hypothetical protein IJY56_04430 [Clostridia bacterium]|nr:hypothetical protein [Clostridia bacterium]